MALTKDRTEIMSSVAVSNSSSTTLGQCTKVDCTKFAELICEAVVQFHASASGDVRIHARASTEDTTAAWSQCVDYGADETGYFDVTCDAGNTVRKTVPLWSDPLYLKFVATNYDDTVAATVTVAYVGQEIDPT